MREQDAKWKSASTERAKASDVPEDEVLRVLLEKPGDWSAECPTCATLARAHACAVWGERMAVHIRAGTHQLGACGKVGIPWHAHMLWMRRAAEPGTPECDYQSAILAALSDAREQALKDAEIAIAAAGEGKASSIANVRLHDIKGRFKRLDTHDEQPNKVELTGADGGPLATAQVDASREQAMEALRLAARTDPALAEQLKKLGGGT